MSEATLEGIAYRASTIDPTRITLLFIHGLSGSLSVWYPFEEQLMTEYNIVTLDLRGHGLSKKFTRYQDYTMDALAGDVVKVLKHLGVKRCTVVSHSLGTLVALEFVHIAPEMIEKIVLISPATGANSLLIDHISHPLRSLGVVGAFLLSKIRPAQGRTGYGPFQSNGDWNLRRIFVDVSNTGRLPYLYTLNHLYAFKNEAWWREIQIPTLIIHGSQDTMVPIAYAKELAHEIPHAEIKIIEGKNHLLPMNSIDELVRSIKEFAK